MIANQLNRGVSCHHVAVTCRYIELKFTLCGAVGETNLVVISVDNIFFCANVNVGPLFCPIVFKLGGALTIFPDFKARTMAVSNALAIAIVFFQTVTVMIKRAGNLLIAK